MELIHWKWIQDKGVNSLKKIQDKGVDSLKMNSTNTTTYRTVIFAASLVEAFSIVILYKYKKKGVNLLKMNSGKGS